MSSSDDTLKISDDTRVYIIDELIEPYYKKVIKNTIEGRQCWRRTGIAFETISKIMVAFGSILSFSAGVYQNETLSFVSGSVSCLSLAFLQFSSFSYKENKKQSEELNVLLKTLGLDTIPVLSRTANKQTPQTNPSQTQQTPLPFQMPFDLSMFQKNSKEEDAAPSTMDNINSLFNTYKDKAKTIQGDMTSNFKETITDIKEDIIDTIEPLSNVNVNVNISANINELEDETEIET